MFQFVLIALIGAILVHAKIYYGSDSNMDTTVYSPQLRSSLLHELRIHQTAREQAKQQLSERLRHALLMGPNEPTLGAEVKVL